MYHKGFSNRPILRFNIFFVLTRAMWAPHTIFMLSAMEGLQIFRKIAVAKLANKRLVTYQGPLILMPKAQK